MPEVYRAPVSFPAIPSTGGAVYAGSGTTLAVTAAGTSGQVLTSNGVAAPSWQTPAAPGVGTVTSVAMTVPSGLSVAGSPITSAGTLAVTLTGGAVIPVPSALTRVDDTNVTLTLGGSPSTALINAASITAGWTGQLSLARGGTNANLSAVNGGALYSTATALAVTAAGTTGQVLTSQGAAAPVWTTPAVTGGSLVGVQVITATGAGTYTPTTGTTSIILELQAGGAGGGGCVQPTGSLVCTAAGGSGGGYIRTRLTSAFSGASYSVGAGGAGGAAGNNIGIAGGNTTFQATGGGTLYTAGGGVGGGPAPAGNTAPGWFGVQNDGGTCTNGSIQVPGGSSLAGGAMSSTSCLSGAGGSSVYSNGGKSARAQNANATTAGNAATGKGGGGSGAAANGTGAAAAGGNGSDGLIIIWEYA